MLMKLASNIVQTSLSCKDMSVCKVGLYWMHKAAVDRFFGQWTLPG